MSVQHVCDLCGAPAFLGRRQAVIEQGPQKFTAALSVQYPQKPSSGPDLCLGCMATVTARLAAFLANSQTVVAEAKKATAEQLACHHLGYEARDPKPTHCPDCGLSMESDPS